jgi:hypothetical protein
MVASTGYFPIEVSCDRIKASMPSRIPDVTSSAS